MKRPAASGSPPPGEAPPPLTPRRARTRRGTRAPAAPGHPPPPRPRGWPLPAEQTNTMVPVHIPLFFVLAAGPAGRLGPPPLAGLLLREELLASLAGLVLPGPA